MVTTSILAEAADLKNEFRKRTGLRVQIYPPLPLEIGPRQNEQCGRDPNLGGCRGPQKWTKVENGALSRQTPFRKNGNLAPTPILADAANPKIDQSQKWCMILKNHLPTKMATW